jgi:hypothetical protein
MVVDMCLGGQLVQVTNHFVLHIPYGQPFRHGMTLREMVQILEFHLPLGRPWCSALVGYSRLR